MASNGGYRSLSVKAAIASAAFLSAAVMIRIAGPSILEFASSDLIKIYASLVSWLTPPYLYFVINGIIISIAASSRFQKSGSGNDPIGSGSITDSAASPIVVVKQQEEFVAPPMVVMEQQEYVVPEEYFKEVVVDHPEYVVPEEYVKDVVVDHTEYVVPAEEEVAAVNQPEYVFPEEYDIPTEENKEEEEEEFVISRSSFMPKSKESTTEYSFLTVQKPPVLSRLGRRKSIKSIPEAGKALGVSKSKPKRHDTLESTWKAITEGRAVPLARHLKKSDTWETHGVTRHPSRAEDPAPSSRLVLKPETFNERKPPPPAAPRYSAADSSSARLRKEPSAGQDDLNRRVEAFIKKFNEEMRLQRQESYKHYMDMINRGSHN